MSHSRAERRRAARARRPAPAPPEKGTIQLVNPQRGMFPAFIAGNKIVYATALFASEAEHGVSHTVGDAAERALPPESVIREGEGRGKHVVICGAGPSLAETAADWCDRDDVDHVWGINSALPWLVERGHRVTHGITVDQQPQMLTEWASVPDVEYLLATTVHPHLSELLLGEGRRVRWFHNFVGITDHPPVGYALCRACETVSAHGSVTCPACGSEGIDDRVMPFEHWMYSALYPPTVVTGGGLTSGTRAIELARWMGYERITVLGQDCAMRTKGRMPTEIAEGSPEHMAWLRENTVMHADGGHALASGATAVTMGAEIDGRWWESKPDMIISAVWLVRLARHDPRVTLVGDTFPNALMDKDDAFLARMPTMTDAEGKPIEIGFEIESIR